MMAPRSHHPQPHARGWPARGDYSRVVGAEPSVLPPPRAPPQTGMRCRYRRSTTRVRRGNGSRSGSRAWLGRRSPASPLPCNGREIRSDIGLSGGFRRGSCRERPCDSNELGRDRRSIRHPAERATDSDPLFEYQVTRRSVLATRIEEELTIHLIRTGHLYTVEEVIFGKVPVTCPIGALTP